MWGEKRFRLRPCPWNADLTGADPDDSGSDEPHFLLIVYILSQFLFSVNICAENASHLLTEKGKAGKGNLHNRLVVQLC